MVYNPGIWDNDWSCENKLWDRKSGMINHCPNRQGCTPSGSILKNFYISIILVLMYTEWSKLELKKKLNL